MKTITAGEFLKITGINPQWATTLTQNVTITGSVFLPENHPLKALSPKLIFQDHAVFEGSQISIAEGVFHQGVNFCRSQIREIGKLTILGTDKNGNAAHFGRCYGLKVARGTFPGFVSFPYSGIQEIAEDFQVTAPNNKGNAANFQGCEHLTVARGTFPGFVDFSSSGIQEIAKTLEITTPNKEGYAADFGGCKNLTVAKGTFPGFVNFGYSEIREITEDLQITAPNQYGFAASFYDCKHLTIAKGDFPGCVEFSNSGIQTIAETLHVTAPNINGNAAYFKYCPHLRIAKGKFSGTVNFTGTLITRARNLEITAQKGKPKAIFTELCLEESPFPLEEIEIPEELKKKLHRKIIQKLHKNLRNHFPPLPQDIQPFHQ